MIKTSGTTNRVAQSRQRVLALLAGGRSAPCRNRAGGPHPLSGKWAPGTSVRTVWFSRSRSSVNHLRQNTL